MCNTKEIGLLLTHFSKCWFLLFRMTFWSLADGNLSKYDEREEKSLHSVTGLIGILKHRHLNSFVRVNVERFN